MYLVFNWSIWTLWLWKYFVIKPINICGVSKRTFFTDSNITQILFLSWIVLVRVLQQEVNHSLAYLAICKKNCVMYFVFFTEIIHWWKFWFIFRALFCQSSFQHFCYGQLQHFYQCWSRTRMNGFPTGHGLSRTILSCTRHFSSYSSWCSYCHL